MNEKAKNLISKYFSKELDEKERVDFEDKLNTDVDFARSVNQRREIESMVNEVFDDGSKTERISGWTTDLNDYKKQKNRQRFIIGGVVALFIVFLGGYFIKHNSKQTPVHTPIALSQEAWRNSPGLNYADLRGDASQAQNEYQSLIVSAFQKYRDQRYSDAITILSDYNTDMPFYEDAQLITGLSQYALGQQTDALKSINNILQLPNSKIRGQALWYAALMHLERDEINSAEPYLNEIVENTYPASAQAKSLLEKLSHSLE